LQAAKDAWDVFRPGGQLHPQYFLEHKWNFIFEGILLVVIAYMFLQRSAPSKKKHERPLSEKVSLGIRPRAGSSLRAPADRMAIINSCLSGPFSHGISNA